MATTFVLGGGNDRETEEFGDKLIEIVRLQVGEPRILSCFFARDESHWEKSAEAWRSWLQHYLKDNFTYDVAQKDTFVEQVGASNVIYLHGGTTAYLESALSQYPSLRDSFEGKLVIGSSAGANFLSTVYYSPSKNAVGYGSGFVDVASVVHYGASDDGEVSLSSAEWHNVVDRVREKSGDARPILLLPEGSITIFTQ